MEKLIRFDWAIKKLLRDKANFSVLEGFLTAVLDEDVTVVNLLESESNQEDSLDKFNRVDLLVENSKGELLLIEVQVKSEYDFFHRIAYGVAKLMTEYLEKGQPYREIKKIISVSITYFSLGIGTDYLYYGSTNFVGVHSKDILSLSNRQQELFGISDVRKIFPEHYLIRVEDFPDKVQSGLDEWIYMLKHSEVRPDFRAKHIQEASARLRMMNLDEPQRKAYDEYMLNMSYQQSMLWSSKEEGRTEGKYEEKIAIARNLLAHGVASAVIAASTGLSEEEIAKLRQRAVKRHPD
ncbi:Rpn family recombination-promoting nuclease/putative transposase [Candidatus Electronema sp. JM]|uniref:Rpn family recombination-promoting nuclease/putative transposase n=1 Tax=Candidatus Electronema sp. JM TaxID=3401571 RepID=UPI003AA7B04E